jgi:hypothetical protein
MGVSPVKKHFRDFSKFFIGAIENNHFIFSKMSNLAELGCFLVKKHSITPVKNLEKSWECFFTGKTPKLCLASSAGEREEPKPLSALQTLPPSQSERTPPRVYQHVQVS